MHRIISRVTSTADRLIEGLGLGDSAYLSFRHEWPTGRLYAGRDCNGALTVELWRFELVVS